MKLGTDLIQQPEQLRQNILQALPADSEAHKLISGIPTTIWNTLLDTLMSKVVTWVSDPANLQLILNKLLEMFTKKS